MLDAIMINASRRALALAAIGFLALLLCPLGAARAAQTAGAEQADAKAKAEKKGALSVRMSKSVPPTFTVKAEEARVADVANEFGRLLKTAVNVSPGMEKRLVSLDFKGLAVEPALRTLAPKTYVDYEMGGDMAQPKLLAIYFYSQSETPPMNSVALDNNNQAILIEGHTEEGTEEYEKELAKEEQFLKISWAGNQLSILARKQPLNVVLYKIASELGIPFDMRHDSTEMVDVDIKNSPLDQAIRSLSPSARLYFRSDLQSLEQRPLRIALVAPAASRT